MAAANAPLLTIVSRRRKMKVRHLIPVFALIAVLVLAACAQVTPAPAPTAAAAQPTTAAAQPTAAQPAGKQFRVAVVMPSAANDLAFSQSMVDALKRTQTEMGKDNFDFV